jgi:hypothetical protein
MKRSISLLIVLALGALCLVNERHADAQAGKTPSIKEVMKKLHGGANSPLVVVRMDLQDEQPDWAEIQRRSQEFVTLGAALAKNDPPKGDKQAWAKLADLYVQDARILAEAAMKRNKKTAVEAHTRLTGSCKGCHTAHRPN